MLCDSLRNLIQPWLLDYARLQSLAVKLIYAQIGCALIGSLGALYNGVLLMNLVISLFALVAIESNNQNLGRTYAVLLFCSIILDISWFIFFINEIWSISFETSKTLFIFSVKLTMAMEIVGFIVRLSSSLLWFQMYRLGASVSDASLGYLQDSDVQNSFLDPPAVARQNSRSSEILGDSIDDQACYMPLIDEGQSNMTPYKRTQVINHHSSGSSSAVEACRNKSPISRSLDALDANLQ